MRLKDYPWWPTSWSSIATPAPNAGEISAKGTLEGCRHSVQGLTIAGICGDQKFSSVITYSSASGIDLKSLEQRLALYLTQPMRVVENIDWP